MTMGLSRLARPAALAAALLATIGGAGERPGEAPHRRHPDLVRLRRSRSSRRPRRVAPGRPAGDRRHLQRAAPVRPGRAEQDRRRPRRALDRLGGRQDLHLPPEEGREVARRAALQLGRREGLVRPHPEPRLQEPQVRRLAQADGGERGGGGSEHRRVPAEVRRRAVPALARVGVVPGGGQARPGQVRRPRTPRRPRSAPDRSSSRSTSGAA